MKVFITCYEVAVENEFLRKFVLTLETIRKKNILNQHRYQTNQRSKKSAKYKIAIDNGLPTEKQNDRRCLQKCKYYKNLIAINKQLTMLKEETEIEKHSTSRWQARH